MACKASYFLVIALGCLCFASAQAQDKAAKDRLYAAHAQYYTPTTRGLQSFHCAATVDWQAMLSRTNGIDIPESNPFLKYLNSVQLSVADELKGKGSMDWTSTTAPPEGKEEALAKIRDGMQSMLFGFFQTWNAYVNGGMVPLPDDTITVATAGTGVHLSGGSSGITIDEDFDVNMLLTQAIVVTPDLRVVATPTYATSPEGLLISAVASQVSQPPNAPQSEADFRVEYAKVDAFQIPSHVVFDIKNVGVIDVRFSACQVSVADWAKKPAPATPVRPSN